MAEPRKLGQSDLKELILDQTELQKGSEIFDQGGLGHLSRHQAKLFCEARGSGASPYKVQLTFSDGAAGAGAVKSRCSCMAARSRPFCKHGAALLVAWSRSPDAFVTADAPPPDAAGGKKKSVKKGAVNTGELMRQGIERVATLVRELGLAGAIGLGNERLQQIGELARSLREHKLRRLSARTLGMVELLSRGGSLPATRYVDLVADLLLTTRKLDKHLAGEALDDRLVEELVGKTWRKTELLALDGLQLCEYAFSTQLTSDGFIIRESRFVELRDGAHFTEKQILPLALSKRTPPKTSHAGRVLEGVRCASYPGYAPVRLVIDEIAGAVALDGRALQRLFEVSVSVSAALAQFQERRKDLFAPPRVPVAVRTDMVLVRGDQLLAVDEAGQALYLSLTGSVRRRLPARFKEWRLRALLGELDLEAGVPALLPMAALVETRRGLELRPLTSDDANEVAGVASVEASTTAASLAEIRDELAAAFVAGLAALVPRTTDPLVARLRDMGLEKQAVLLEQLSRRPDPGERLDDFIKLYQVLEIALVRLLAGVTVERASVVSVPTYQSLFIPRPEQNVPLAEIGPSRKRGAMTDFEAAVHYAAHYQALPAEQLAREVFPTWADGDASPYVVRAVAEQGDAAIEAARRALHRGSTRVARMTAVRVLEAVGSASARQLLDDLRQEERDPVLRELAADALDALAGSGDTERQLQRASRRAAAMVRAVNEVQQTDRVAGIRAVVDLGDRGDLGSLRELSEADPSREVRTEARLALGALLDVDMVAELVAGLRLRVGDPTSATTPARVEEACKANALALGAMGDVRGLLVLVEAWVEGWKLNVICAALLGMGTVAVTAVLDEIERAPALGERKPALELFKQQAPDELAGLLCRRLEALRDSPDLATRAAGWLKLSAVNPEARVLVARRLLELLPTPGDKETKALRRAAERALAPRPATVADA